MALLSVSVAKLSRKIAEKQRLNGNLSRHNNKT